MPGKDHNVARISTKKNDVWQYVRSYVVKNGYGPSYREILEACGFKSKNSISQHLAQLKAAGLITYTPLVARSIQLTRKGEKQKQI